MKPYLSSENHTWQTPQWLFDLLHFKLNFTVDAAAASDNTMLPLYWDKQTNGLLQDWLPHTVWCNPPYGKPLNKWVYKAYNTWKSGGNCVLLIPARPDTVYWHNFLLPEKDIDILWLKGRLRFTLNGKESNTATFPSALIFFVQCKDLKEKLRSDLVKYGVFR